MDKKNNIKWPIFLTKHGDEHLSKGGEYDIRLSTLSFDNATELFLKLFLNDIDKKVNFPSLLNKLKNSASDKLRGIDLEEIGEFHKLRNSLYHAGGGEFDPDNISRYSKISKILCYNLFNMRIETDKKLMVSIPRESLFNDSDFFKAFFFQHIVKHPLDSLFYLYDYYCKKSKEEAILRLKEYHSKINNEILLRNFQEMPLLSISLFLHCGTKIDSEIIFSWVKYLSPELLSAKAEEANYSFMIIQSICNAWTRLGRINKEYSDDWKKKFLESLPTKKLSNEAEKRSAQHLYHLLKEFKRVAPEYGANLIKTMPNGLFEKKLIEARGKGNLRSELSRIYRRLLEYEKLN